MPRIVVDGANVVGSRPDGWWRDRGAAAARLADQLRALVAADPEFEIVLVLEGAARAGQPATEPGPEASTRRLQVVHAPASGDDEIVRRSAGADLVITADRELRRRVAPVPCEGPRWLLSRLN